MSPFHEVKVWFSVQIWTVHAILTKNYLAPYLHFYPYRCGVETFFFFADLHISFKSKSKIIATYALLPTHMVWVLGT